MTFQFALTGSDPDIDTIRDHKCPYLPTKENETLVNDFRDHVLAQIRDIEDLGELGKRIGICPYYASRQAIKPTEVCPASLIRLCSG